MEKRINIHSLGFIYFSLFFIAVAFNEEERYLKFPKLDELFLKNMLNDLCLGLVVGLIVVLVTWILVKYYQPFQDLLKNFQSLLGPLTKTEIFFISAFSSLGEEFFFRGMVQGTMGIVFASILFGALHVGPGKKFLPWTAFAVVMGFVLGGLYEWRDNLVLPVMAHFVVNFLNLLLYRNQESPTVPQNSKS